MTPEQIRERMDVLKESQRAAVKAVGEVKRKMRLLQKDCPHTNCYETTHPFVAQRRCKDCDKTWDGTGLES